MILRCRWSATDKLRLIELWPVYSAAECGIILGRTPGAVETKASELGLRKGKKYLAVVRKVAQKNTDPKQAGYLDGLAPAKPTVCPVKAMAGVWFEDVPLKSGRALDGDALARAVRFMA